MHIHKKYRLGEIAEVQTGPFGSQLHMKDYKKVGTPIITVEHLGDNKIIHNDLPLVGDDDKERLIKYILKEGDIVFSRVGSVDRRAYVTNRLHPHLLRRQNRTAWTNEPNARNDGTNNF